MAGNAARSAQRRRSPRRSSSNRPGSSAGSGTLEPDVFDGEAVIAPKRTASDESAGSAVAREPGPPIAQLEEAVALEPAECGEDRCGHAHRQLQQLVIAASGSFDVTVDDGAVRRTYQLNRSYTGLYLPPMVWGQLTNFSSGSVALVLASGRIDWKSIVTHRIPIARFEEAWETHREGTGLKVCVYPGDG